MSLIIRNNGDVVYDSDPNTDENKEFIHEWKIKTNGVTYKIAVYADTMSDSLLINQYEFPPPIDTISFYGEVFLFAHKKVNHVYKPTNLTVDLWKSLYRDMFKFERLHSTSTADEDEIDELELIPVHAKTKDGYLKDGFVVDDDDDDDDDDECEE